jgi:Ca-activated chloride channel family protein
MVRANAGIVLVVTAAFVCGCSEEQRPGSTAARHVETQADLGASRYERAVKISGEFSKASVPSLVPADVVPQAGLPQPSGPEKGVGPQLGGDKYALIEESGFLSVKDAPLSTFSIDVDTASYAKTRAYLLEHRTLPPPDAVRIEELINYFEYSYAEPTHGHPFAVHIETAECPWQAKHRLVRFGIQGKRIERERPASNLVFLIDVSGSMDEPRKLPLVQRGLSMLVRQLEDNDRVAIVVYAGAAGLVLPPTSGMDQSTILAAIGRLRAGGSTNGGQGIQLAYQIARDHFIDGGGNRVLLCTDGDFNVGTTSTGDLVRLAQEQAKSGVYLTVLGFGFGNHNDAMLEQLSNKANGNYAFIDSDREACKVLVEQLQGTLVTIAKDVKLQVEFNPVQVAAYRLIGYENRRLADRDFNDDTKDAGDIGAGHSVTALYEIVPVGIESPLGRPDVDPLKYQESEANALREKRWSNVNSAAPGPGLVLANEVSGELLTLKLRYQPPGGGASTLLEYPVNDSGARFASASPDLQFATAVASFGMLLRNSSHKGDASYAAVLETASACRGEDQRGRRGEFLELVRAAQRLSGEKLSIVPAGWPRGIRSGRTMEYRTMEYVVKSKNPFGLGLAIGVLLTLAIVLVCSIVAMAGWRRPICYAPAHAAKFGPAQGKWPA